MNQRVGTLTSVWTVKSPERTESIFNSKIRIWSTNPSIVFFLASV